MTPKHASFTSNRCNFVVEMMTVASLFVLLAARSVRIHWNIADSIRALADVIRAVADLVRAFKKTGKLTFRCISEDLHLHHSS